MASQLDALVQMLLGTMVDGAGDSAALSMAMPLLQQMINPLVDYALDSATGTSGLPISAATFHRANNRNSALQSFANSAAYGSYSRIAKYADDRNKQMIVTTMYKNVMGYDQQQAELMSNSLMGKLVRSGLSMTEIGRGNSILGSALFNRRNSMRYNDAQVGINSQLQYFAEPAIKEFNKTYRSGGFGALSIGEAAQLQARMLESGAYDNLGNKADGLNGPKKTIDRLQKNSKEYAQALGQLKGILGDDISKIIDTLDGLFGSNTVSMDMARLNKIARATQHASLINGVSGKDLGQMAAVGYAYMAPMGGTQGMAFSNALAASYYTGRGVNVEGLTQDQFKSETMMLQTNIDSTGVKRNTAAAYRAYLLKNNKENNAKSFSEFTADYEKNGRKYTVEDTAKYIEDSYLSKLPKRMRDSMRYEIYQGGGTSKLLADPQIAAQILDARVGDDRSRFLQAIRNSVKLKKGTTDDDLLKALSSSDSYRSLNALAENGQQGAVATALRTVTNFSNEGGYASNETMLQLFKNYSSAVNSRGAALVGERYKELALGPGGLSQFLQGKGISKGVAGQILSLLGINARALNGMKKLANPEGDEYIKILNDAIDKVRTSGGDKEAVGAFQRLLKGADSDIRALFKDLGTKTGAEAVSFIEDRANPIDALIRRGQLAADPSSTLLGRVNMKGIKDPKEEQKVVDTWLLSANSLKKALRANNLNDEKGRAAVLNALNTYIGVSTLDEEDKAIADRVKKGLAKDASASDIAFAMEFQRASSANKMADFKEKEIQRSATLKSLGIADKDIQAKKGALAAVEDRFREMTAGEAAIVRENRGRLADDTGKVTEAFRKAYKKQFGKDYDENDEEAADRRNRILAGDKAVRELGGNSANMDIWLKGLDTRDGLMSILEQIKEFLKTIAGKK